MLALIAGTGALPPALVGRLAVPPLVCAMRGFAPDLPVDLHFRIEHLGSFLQDLQKRGVQRICMAGAVRRPPVDPGEIDAATAPLVPRIQAALTQGDDGALRVFIGIMEEMGFTIVPAHELASDLIPHAGVLTKAGPASSHTGDAFAGEACVAQMGVADTGQACVIRDAAVVMREDAHGTDAMLKKLALPKAQPDMDFDPFSFMTDMVTDMASELRYWLVENTVPHPQAEGGILFKAPKPAQDLRADLPLIGPRTAMGAAEAGLDGIVIEAGGVMVLEMPAVRQILDAQGMFLWVRPRGGL